jgi:hypothetical protein
MTVKGYTGSAKQRDHRETTGHASCRGLGYSVSDVDQILVQTRLARKIPTCTGKEGSNKYELREAELTYIANPRS